MCWLACLCVLSYSSFFCPRRSRGLGNHFHHPVKHPDTVECTHTNKTHTISISKAVHQRLLMKIIWVFFIKSFLVFSLKRPLHVLDGEPSNRANELWWRTIFAFKSFWLNQKGCDYFWHQRQRQACLPPGIWMRAALFSSYHQYPNYPNKVNVL